MKKFIYLLILILIFTSIYFLYFKLSNVTDEQVHRDVESFFLEQGYIGDYSDYISHELRIRESGVNQYNVRVTYSGVKDDSLSKLSRVFVIQQVTEGLLQKFILVETQKGRTYCSRGRVWFGELAGTCK